MSLEPCTLFPALPWEPGPAGLMASICDSTQRTEVTIAHESGDLSLPRDSLMHP